MKPTIRDVRRCYSKIKQLARTAISERDYNRAAGELALSARIAPFASSRTYELLFDFSSRQWAEGPDNLRFVWEQERRNG